MRKKIEIRVNERAEVFCSLIDEYLGRIDSDGDWRASSDPEYNREGIESQVRAELKRQFEERELSNWPSWADWPVEVLRFLGEREDEAGNQRPLRGRVEEEEWKK